MGSGSTMPRIHSPALQAQAAGSRSLGAASPRRQGAPASAPAAAMAAPGGTQSAAEGAAASDGLRGLVGELEERLASLLPSVGVVHLGCSQAAGSFVLRWRQRLQVVVEPSSQATALLEEAGLDPAATRLVDVFSRQPTLELPGARTVTALSSQTQWAEGGPLSSFLLSASSPVLLLPAPGIATLTWLLRGRLVVATAALSPEFVAALLAAGASGVICRASSKAALQPSGSDCGPFFDVLYEVLLQGSRVTHALHMAEARVPELAGMFTVHLPEF